MRDGNGLDSQEQACRAWAKQKGFIVDRVFREQGISGSKADRPALKAMLKFLMETKEKYIVLALDINRFARDVIVYGTLKQQILKLGHSVQTVNMTLDETEESNLLETMSSAVSEYERKKNKARTIANMKEHLKQGYWVMRAIVGYTEKRIARKIHHVRNEPSASYIQEALEGFASCRFLTQKDVLEFLKDKPLTIFGGRPVKLTFNAVNNILRNERYTGYFAYRNANCDIPYQKWAIDPIISIETFKKIQDRLNGKKGIQARKYNMDDEAFPLRRFVRCACCGEKLTASKPKSKSGKRHMYYHCHNKLCDMYGKGIKQADIHKDFEQVLQTMTPNKKMILASKELIRESYEEQTADVRNAVLAKETKISFLKDEKQKAFDVLMSNSDVPEIAHMCKEKINALAADIQQLEDSLQTSESLDIKSLEQATDCVIEFLTKPLQIWTNGNYDQKQGVLNLCFREPVSYGKDKKFGTPALSPIFGIFSDFSKDSEKWCTQKDSNSQSSDP